MKYRQAAESKQKSKQDSHIQESFIEGGSQLMGQSEDFGSFANPFYKAGAKLEDV